jgi:hypothetical protein
MATVFWDCEGLLLCEFLPPETTTSSEKYCKTLEKLCKAIKRKRLGQLQGFYMMEHDLTVQPRQRPGCKNRSGKEVLQHPPHSPDLVSSDFYLFGPFKNFLSGKRYEDQNTLQKTVVQYVTSLGKEHYREGLFKLVKSWNKCLNANGDYIEK